MPAARAICYKSSLLAGGFIFYGKQESLLSHDLYLAVGLLANLLFSNGNKNLRYRLVSRVYPYREYNLKEHCIREDITNS
jgi:hypothetical protein